MRCLNGFLGFCHSVQWVLNISMVYAQSKITSIILDDIWQFLYTDSFTLSDMVLLINSDFPGMICTGLQIYGGPGSLSHDFKIWPITFQGSGPSGPILYSCEKISL